MAEPVPGRIPFLQTEGIPKLADPADDPGDSARICEGASLDFSNISNRIAAMLNKQVELLEAEPLQPGFSEERVKSLLALAKTVHAMEALSNKLLESKNGNFDEPKDILEFRRQLEKKIEALSAGRADS